MAAQPSRLVQGVDTNGSLQRWRVFLEVRGANDVGTVVAVFRALLHTASIEERTEAWRLLLEAEPPPKLVREVAELLGGGEAPRRVAGSARSFSQNILLAAAHLEVEDGRTRWSPRDVGRFFEEQRWDVPTNVSHLLGKLRAKGQVDYRKNGRESRNWRLTEEGRRRAARLGGPEVEPAGEDGEESAPP